MLLFALAEIWPFLFCFSPETVHGTTFSNFSRKFFEVFPLAEIFSTAHNYQILAGSAAVRLVQKSSKSEPSSRFFGRLKIFRSNWRFLRYKLSEIQIGSWHSSDFYYTDPPLLGFDALGQVEGGLASLCLHGPPINGKRLSLSCCVRRSRVSIWAGCV